jgi:fibronectin-binding autotransporter adhesin
LVFSASAAASTNGGSWNGPTSVLGGLLEFNSDTPIKSTAWIQVSAGGAVGSGTSLADNSFTNLLGAAPGAQAGGLALSPTDNTVVDTIDFAGLVAGEGAGYNQLINSTDGNDFNMKNVALANLTAMSIGATSGIGSNGTGNELAAVQFSGTILPGKDSGIYTYQLGGGGTLNLIPVTHGRGGTMQNPGVPLANVSGTLTNVLIENGGAVRLTETNTYTGTTTINGVLVEATPGQAALPSTVTLPGGAPATTATFVLERTILSVTNLADTGSSIGNSAVATPSNLVINGGVLQYIGAGDTSNRVFTIGTLGATLDNSGSGTLNLAATTTEAYLAGTSSTSLTLQGTYGIVAPVGTSSFVNTLAGTLVDPATGSLSLVKSGTGAWALTNVLNTYSGGTTVSGGVLEAGGPTNLPVGGGTGGIFGSTAGAMTVNTGSTLDLNGNNVTVGALSGGGIVDSIAAATSSPVFTVGSGNATSTFSGSINNTSGTVSLVSTGTGTTLLTGASNYLGTTTIAAGNTLQLGNGGTSGSINGASLVLDSGSLVLDQSANVTFANVVSLTGSVTTAGTGTVTFTGSNTYTGGTTISAGATRPGNGNALGTGIVTDNSLLGRQAKGKENTDQVKK